MAEKSSAVLNSFRRRAHTIARKATDFHAAVFDEFGSCSLRDAAAELELKSRRLLDHIDTIIIGTGNP